MSSSKEKIHYLENQLNNDTKQSLQVTSTRKVAKSENNRKIEDHTEKKPK